MTKALPFTEASVARAIKGVERAGRFVIGVKVADGTLIVGDKPVEAASILPDAGQDAPTIAARRFGDKLNGDQRAT